LHHPNTFRIIMINFIFILKIYSLSTDYFLQIFIHILLLSIVLLLIPLCWILFCELCILLWHYQDYFLNILDFFVTFQTYFYALMMITQDYIRLLNYFIYGVKMKRCIDFDWCFNFLINFLLLFHYKCLDE
jgi:hypothetical protein